MKPMQLLTQDGEFTPCPNLPLDVTAELCQDLLRHMVLARRFDQEAYSLQRQGELGLWLQSWGQEAAQIGSIAAVRSDDWVFPSYRDHAAALHRGIEPGEIMSQWRGCSAGGWNPHEYRFHVNTLVLATQLLHATGFAMGVKLEGSDEVVLSYFGDGSSSEGDASEALNWAVTFECPIVFVCQNNQWAISTPVGSQTTKPLHERAAGFGLDSYLVDGNDVLAVLAATRQAAQRTRAGHGPSFIEVVTFRMGGHSTSDDPTAYRSADEVRRWEARDPITRLRTFMNHKGWLDDDRSAALDAEAAALAAATRAACKALAAPDLAELFDQVLSSPTPLLQQEKLALLAERDLAA
ncbi:thiamine pyrophosphate-dependent enzyme [Nocardia sp. NPDC050799]|uniref:thiamine pyrophosphate-dependent dehydrogenase E1 component subunit alpha n=1 Tax=Nocardia sp. NPDC050799 TaxID=3154842 RepID=UPI0033C177CE